MIRRLISLLRRPRLSVSIVARDAAPHLPDVIGRARAFADEIVVGVDAASLDDTWNVACALADTVYRFTHPGQLAPAHMLALEYCTGDWILRLDADEWMDADFARLLPELVATNTWTHYYFPRKLVMSVEPPLYLHGYPWYPDHALRLFRNMRSLVWKPPRYHTGYFVAGCGRIENRCAVLHLENLWCTPERRKDKRLEYHRGGGMQSDADDYYKPRKGELRAFAMPPDSTGFRRRASPRIDAQTHALAVSAFPPWGCRFDEVDMPRTVLAGQLFAVDITLTNTGKMAWFSATSHWPVLSVVARFHAADTAQAPFDGGRLAISGQVLPGESVRLNGWIRAPECTGPHVVSWDMLSENECWFAQCGNEPFEVPLTVIVTGE